MSLPYCCLRVGATMISFSVTNSLSGMTIALRHARGSSPRSVSKRSTSL